jgi:PAS domain S-box-containing protein
MNIVQDITERKKKQKALIEAQEKIRESEQLYREIFNNSHDGICLLEVKENSRFRLLAVNAQYEKERGITSEQCVGNTMEDNVGTEVAAFVNAQYQRYIDAGTITEEIIEVDMPMGVRNYHSKFIPIRDNTGKIYRIMRVTHDITDELNNKREIERSKNLLNNAEVIASIGHFYRDFLNDKLYCSRGVYEIFGMPFDENVLENLDVFKFVHPEDMQRINDRLSYAFETKTKFSEEHRIINQNGVEKVIHTVCNFMIDSQNNELLFGNIRDVSDVYALKNQVIIGEEKIRILVENMPMGILISSGRTPIYINQTMLELMGVSSLAEFLKINPLDLVHPDDRNSIKKLLEKLFAEKSEATATYQLTLRSLERNGKVGIFDVRFVSCWMDNSRYLQITVIDITDEIEKEKFLSQLASDSLYISQKNSTILSIKHELDEILKVKCLRCDNGPDFRNILKILDLYSNADCDWGLFNKQFENLHPEFIQYLNIICPSLTTYDIKHCACIRLDLDTKEIAIFFNVEPASIQKSRVRLKKKLCLPQNVDLREFIMCL